MKKLTLISAICSVMYTDAVMASDLEIYSAAQKGNVNIALMLDTSGSMGSLSLGLDYNLKCGAYWNGRSYTYARGWKKLDDKPYTYTPASGTGFTINVARYGCYGGYLTGSTTWIETNTTPYYDRLTRLKTGIIGLLTSNKLKDDVALGLGNYSSGGDSKTGQMLLPVKKLSYTWPDGKTQRQKIAETMVALSATGGTPTAHAYAESGAYMLGSNTADGSVQTVTKELGWLRYYGRRWYLYKCPSTSNTPDRNGWLRCSTNYTNSSIVDRKSNRSDIDLSKIGAHQGDISVSASRLYGLRETKYVPNSADSGFGKSDKSTKIADTTKYHSPLQANRSCDGNGIYFLTDGSPNNSSERRAKSLMDYALNTGDDKTVDCSSNLVDVNHGGYRDTGWRCVGDFAKKLRDKDKNAAKAEIKTAVVGFGALYSKLTKKNDGTFDCRFSDKDVENTCKWGEEGYGYGEGGFDLATKPEDVARTIIEFAGKLDTEVEPISTGNFSVPFDTFGSKHKFDSYLPMLDPSLKHKDLWVGNVKKYTIKDGAMVGKNDNAVLNVLRNDGTFNKNTKDFWNYTTAANDDGKSQKGGVLSNIFKKHTVSGTTNTVSDSKQRNLWVDIKKTDGSKELVNLKVDSDKKPDNFDDLDAVYTNKGKRQLINFLGYNEPVNSDAVADSTALASSTVFNANHKAHGAVLHSTPRLLTKKIAYLDGKLKAGSREDFMLYGAFDGSLRVVDDKNGTEALTFVPRHLVKHQGDYLVPKSTGSAKQRYGVDGVWNVYADYASKSSTADGKTTVSLEAKNVVVAGGLRMGGSKYYALNLANADFSEPELLYNVGSGYGPDGGDDGTGDADFARMGQSWGMPSIGYVKTGENTDGSPQRTMVHFLPGGYDLKYEQGNDLTNTKTQGNAVYMVKVGEVSADLVKEDGVVKNDNGTQIDYTDAGKRMWWASADATNVTTGSKLATRVADMKSSIVGTVVPLDRDYDGVTDHIYYADLNGRVFRADIDNTGTTFKIARVVKLLDVSAEKNATDSTIPADKLDKSSPRFYEAPLITFTRWKHGAHKGKIVAMVTVASGNRSRPVELKRSNSKPDRVYTFVDYDVASNAANFFDDANYSKKTSELGLSDLIPLKFSGTGTGKTEEKTDSKTVKEHMTLTTNAKQGWYYDLVHWGDATTRSVGLRGVGATHAIESLLFFTVFNPNPETNSTDSCSASIKGETQRDVLCLPFGACNSVDNDKVVKVEIPVPGADPITKVLDKYQPIPAGKGIVDNTIGLLNTSKGGFGVIKNDPASCDSTVNPYCESYGNNDYLVPKEWRER